MLENPIIGDPHLLTTYHHIHFLSAYDNEEEKQKAMEEQQIMQEPEEGYSDLSLRPMDLSDVDDFMVWATDDRVSRFCRWNTYTCLEDGINFIENTVLPHPWFRAICSKDRAVGAISVSPNANSEDQCRAELGYVVASKCWGRGVATRAVKMAAAAVFAEWPNLERIEALVDVENGGSQRVLEKAGFTREGVLRKYFVMKGRTRDMVMFSLLSTDPIP